MSAWRRSVRTPATSTASSASPPAASSPPRPRLSRARNVVRSHRRPSTAPPRCSGAPGVSVAQRIGEGRIGPARLRCMSQCNVEVVRRGLQALSSGDIERILEFVDPEFEGQVPPELSTEPDTYRGHAGIRHYFQSFWDDMEDIRFQADRLWDAGDSVVVATRMT